MSKIHKATWLHKLPSTPQDVRALAQRVAEAGFEMLIPCVKQPTGIADYQSKIAKVRGEYKTWDPLMILAEEADKLGLSVHAWCCVFTEGEDSNLLNSRPELTAVAGREQAKTEDFRLGCPNRPEVQDYEAALYQELIDNYPIAGVHLDYIRFTSGLCYCDYCQADYFRATGGDLNKLGFFAWNNAAAQDMDRWIAWRCEIVTRFVRRIRQASTKAAKELSAAVFFYYPGGLQDIGQDWEAWVRQGLLDYVFPMNYSSSTLIASKWTRNNVAAIKGAKGCRLWEGIHRPAHMTTPRFMEHVRGVLDAGVEGVTIFEYPDITDEDFAEMKKLQ